MWLGYKKIGYNINILQNAVFLVVNPIRVGNFAFLFRYKKSEIIC